MAKIPYVTLSSTINTQRLIINRIIDSIGDLALLTTDSNSTLVGAINEVDARLDSINSTQLNTVAVVTNILTVTDSANIAGDLDVSGDLSIAGNFNVTGDFVVSGNASYETQFLLFSDSTGTQDAGISVFRGTGNDSAVLKWDETNDYWVAGTVNSLSKIIRESDLSVGLKAVGGVVSIDSAEIVNYAVPIRGLFTGGDGLTYSSGNFAVGPGVGIKVGADDVSIDSAEIVNYSLPIRALFSGDSNILYSSVTGAIKLDSSLSVNTITVDNLNGDSATFTGVVNALDFNSTSDIKFKENVASLENSINTLNQIRPVSFNWIGGNKSYGVIAQELEQILPELVNEDKYGIKRVSYTPIIALLIDAIKAHEIEIKKLKNCQCNCK